ncbi:MAG TPA: SAM-dependent methyltransferase [Bryobacteraceae bacterium]
MRSGEPSRTALAAARHRAAHQLLEHGSIFADPLAVRILGEDADTIAREAEENRSRRMMRMFIAVRTRFAEEALAAAVEGGVTQLVVLGAGLDTYAWRGAMRERIRIFEVDYPATQAWKRRRLAEAELPFPPCLTFAPVDFEASLEKDILSAGLQSAGFDPAQPTFFTWLGVVPYLTEDAVWSTLGFIASLPNGAHVVFDYSNPPDTLTPEMRAFHDTRAARVAELGESWNSYFDSDKLRSQLIAAGFSTVEDLGPREIATRYFPHRVAVASETGGHVIRAATV